MRVYAASATKTVRYHVCCEGWHAIAPLERGEKGSAVVVTE